MDWVFAGGTGPGTTGPPAKTGALANRSPVDATVQLIADHLRRHATDPARAELAARLGAEAVRQNAGGPGTGWATLDWSGAYATLTVRHITEAVQLPTAPLAPEGVWAPDEYIDELRRLFQKARAVALALPASRSSELEVVLPPVSLTGDITPANFLGHVASTLVCQVEAGASMIESAAAAGTGAAKAALASYVRGHNGEVPTSPREVAEAFAEFVNASGADFFVSEADDRRAVLVNRVCPFGSGVEGQHSLCRVTTGLLGSLAARAAGNAGVSLSEAIAAGDPRCNAVVDFTATGSRWSQRYSWPQPPRLAPAMSTRGFRMTLSLQLPRDKLSVGVLRHLVSDVLREVGVLDEDRSDVELAVTEAAANVIEHSGAGDAYEVTVTIGPSLAELRVVDVGRGFDHILLSETVAGPDDERGRGLALMNALVDQVRFVSAPERGTVVHLIKRLGFDDLSPARRLMLASLASEQAADGTVQSKEGAAAKVRPSDRRK